jgi:hypothetical protein
LRPSIYLNIYAFVSLNFSSLKAKDKWNFFSIQYFLISERGLLFEYSQAKLVCSDKRNVEMEMSVEHWWNDTDGRKPNYSRTPFTTPLVILIGLALRVNLSRILQH